MSETSEAQNEVASEVVDAPSKSRELALLAGIEKVKVVLAEVKRVVASTPFDINSAAGEKIARQLRARLVSTRTAADDAYTRGNAPYLADQKAGRELRDLIKAEVKLLEDPLDAAITARDEQRKAEQLAKQEAEKKRIEGIQAQIESIRRAAVIVSGTSAADIGLIILEAEKVDCSPTQFEEWSSSAQRAKDETLDRLRELHVGAIKHEAEMEQIRRDREELERMRREQAARDAETARQAAIEAAARAEAERIERERVAAEQKAEAQRIAEARRQLEAEQAAARAEQQRRDAEAAAARAEADRVAAVHRAEADRIAREAREAEEARQAEARAELERKQQDVDRAALERLRRSCVEQRGDEAMTKPIYSIDAPDQQKLKTARIEIEAILKKHDIAGVVVLHTPGMGEFFYDILPSYSRCWIDEQAGMVRIASKLDRDHGGNLELQKHDQAATANMVASIADNLKHAASMFAYVQRIVDKGLRAEHTAAGFVADPREANKH